ncbi:uncharacterized protein LOC126672200 [Mercurialis annua]|uniref:uncharacterized protein LOC126672200 n=1 Tax=Mercurialis annua TaxID=3986 RepID=UPI00215DE31A|nr:uncharacterized protein LOC126672200 [Mercurialis annua]
MSAICHDIVHLTAIRSSDCIFLLPFVQKNFKIKKAFKTVTTDYKFKNQETRRYFFLSFFKLSKKMNNPHHIYHQNDTVEIVTLAETIIYFPARILEVIGEDHQNYRVEYLTRFSDEALTTPLIKVLPYAVLKPTPPELNDRFFVESDTVDAYIDGYWKMGVLIGNFHGPDYIVMMNPEPVTTDRIRFHGDWISIPRFWLPLSSSNDRFPDLIVRHMQNG